MIVLQVLGPDGAVTERRVTKGACVVGRSSSADLAIPDRALSRTHARIFEREGDWLVEDLGSRNGTRHNGQAVTHPVSLRTGDEVELGGSRLTVVSLGGDPLPSAAVSSRTDATLFRPAREVLDAQSSGFQKVDREGAPPGRYVQRLRLLNEVHDALGRSVEIDELLRLILDRAFTLLAPEEGAIYLRTAEGEYSRVAQRARPGAAGGGLDSRHLLHEVVENGMAALVLDAQEDSRFNQAQSLLNAGVRSLVAAPLLDPEGALGMMVLGSRLHVRQFAEEDMELLVSLASVAAMRIRNLRLAEEAAERRRLQQEVELARRIQVGLLPRELPNLEGYELHAGNLPSRGVSGDFYTIHLRPESDECVIQLADVSGKGIAAALLTASLEALSAGPIAGGAAPEELCDQVSHLLYARTPMEKYATAFIAVLHRAAGELVHCSAGHTPALVVGADGEVRWLRSTGPPIGLLPASVYRAETTPLAPGDMLVTYSDGITEAENPEEEEYGTARLEAVCVEHRGKPLREIAAAVERDLQAFARGVPYADDRTLVLLRRSADGS